MRFKRFVPNKTAEPTSNIVGGKRWININRDRGPESPYYIAQKTLRKSGHLSHTDAARPFPRTLVNADEDYGTMCRTRSSTYCGA